MMGDRMSSQNLRISQLLVYLLLAVTILASSPVADAALTGCPEQYFDSIPPQLLNPKLANKSREICYSQFAILHSGVTKTPLYSAEHLTRAKIVMAKKMVRHSKFFADQHLPITERAELRDYARSGYDRGHIAPSGDMPDVRSQQECFSLANMVPQVPENNRGVWEGVESAVRKLTLERGDLYVITGPIFRGEHLQRIGGMVLVPTHLFKAVYDPARKEAGAYLVDNVKAATAMVISITKLETLTGIAFFPSVPAAVKAREMKLPGPKQYRQHRRRDV
jgi:endonuclease G, mitochondrial